MLFMLFIPSNSMFASDNTYATHQAISVEMQNKTIKQILDEIEAQSEFTFFYNTTVVDVNKVVSINTTNQNIFDVLNEVFKDSNISYQVIDKRILLANKQNAETKSTGATQQSTPITGVVTDKDGEPIIGASITVKGTSIGTVTDLDGKFSINAPANSTLNITYIGYAQTSINVKDKKYFDISLQEDDNLLEEVVVVGYGTQKKANLTGAVSTVDASALANRAGHSVSQMIQGKVPGLTVTSSSGRPGASSSLNIRGITSLNGKGEPLIIIDGIEGSLETINPNDIENISVLKDASASAVYGARASFGVVLVTTKQGEKGKRTTVKYSGQFGWQQNTTSTDYETRGYYSVWINDLFWRSYQGNNYTNYTEDDYNELWIRRNDKTEHPDRPWVVIDQRDGKDSYTYYGNTDWYHYLYRDTRPTMKHNVSLSGGSDMVSYYASAGFYNGEGLFKTNTDRYKQIDFRGKIDFKINDKMDFSTNISYLSNSYKYPGVGGVNTAFHLDKVHGLASLVPENPDGTMVYNTSLSRYVIMDGLPIIYKNPNNKNDDKRDQTSVTAEYTYKPIKGLELKTNFSYRYNSQSYMNRQTNLQYSKYPGVIETLSTGSRFEDKLYERINTHRYYAYNLYGTYTKTIAKNHNFKAMAGYNWEKQTLKDLKATGWNLTDPTLADLNLVGQDADGNRRTDVGGGFNEFSLMGVFGRLNYDYMGKYLVELSARYDGSSRFIKKDRWGFFPSGSLGWRLSEESFYGSAKNWLEDVKLRFSYGTIGNQVTSSNYEFVRTISLGTQSYLFGGDKPAIATIKAPIAGDLTWEKAIHYNLGADITTLNNRLSFTGDFYIRDTKDILTSSIALPAVYGASAPSMNAVDLRTKGYELSLTWRDSHMLLGDRFSYSITATFNDYISNITKFDNPEKVFTKGHYVGKRLGEIWGYKVDGLFRSDEEAKEYTSVVDQSYLDEIMFPAGVWKGGDMKFLDLDGDNVILPGVSVDNPRDQIIIGNSEPRYHYGFTTSASWYGFDFSIFFQGVGKKDWYPEPDTMGFWSVYARPYATYIPKDFHKQFWSEENPDAYFPRPRGYLALQGSRRQLTAVNDRYLQDISYLRLKNLTVGYTLPQKWTRLAKIENLRIYFSGENLATWTGLKSDYIDPESIITNNIYGTSNNYARTYPMPKTYTVGIDITF